ncbi:autotransporter assembly complex family protein [Ideonella sp. A 288]|uniref:autotransporter assembly complex protein TamA n=1 Tax=Ideonella sp. A 288 TaxID=1962181 RepID=UPI000B4BA1EB|nr:BamA/TamA family outer membrane protein [Ideonella sp. A 288]
MILPDVRRAAGTLALVVVALLAGGCSTLSELPLPGLSRPAVPPGALQVEIDAPPELKTLLAQHLDLSRAMQLRDDEALDAIEVQRLLVAAPAQARDLLRTEGYFEPEITVQRSPGTPVRATLKVRTGPRVRVRQVSVRVEGEIDGRAAGGDAAAQNTLGRLRAAGPLREGVAFRNPDWAETKRQWLATLRAAGYAAATLTSSRADIDEATTAATLEVALDSGPLFLAGPLNVEGLQRHDLATVQHLAGFSAGTPLTEVLLLDYQDRLQKAGLFEAVSVAFDPTQGPAAAPVTVRLHELPLQQAVAGAGISTDNGPRLSLEHTHRRPFDWAVTSYNKLEWGRDAQRWGGDFLTHPGAGFTRWLLGVQIERERSDTDVVLSQRLRAGRTRDTKSIERLEFAELLRSRQITRDGVVIDAMAASANLHLVLRRLDSVLLPTRGYSLSLQLGAGQARSTQADSGPFTRVQARLTGYLPLGDQWYAKARVEAGQIVKRDSVVVPDALGFRAGGDESVRGYGYRTLTPTVGGSVVSGNAVLTASAELARPIWASMPSVWGAVFVDAGRAVDRWQDYKPALGYGVGVRWRSPIGPVRADVAWADELRKARLHLTVGVTF